MRAGAVQLAAGQLSAHAARGGQAFALRPRPRCFVRACAGAFGAAWIALRGDLPGTVSSLASYNFLLLFPFKFAVSYTILYHWLGGLRHFVWDHHKIGNQVRRRCGREPLSHSRTWRARRHAADGALLACARALLPQADKTSLLELPTVEKSSQALFIGAAALSFIAAVL